MNSPVGIVLIIAAVMSSVGSIAPAAAVSYSFGDVFAGVGDGKVDHYTSTGTLLETLDTTTGSSEQTGMCFDDEGNLYTTDFTAGKMSRFDKNGVLLDADWGRTF